MHCKPVDRNVSTRGTHYEHFHFSGIWFHGDRAAKENEEDEVSVGSRLDKVNANVAPVRIQCANKFCDQNKIPTHFSAYVALAFKMKVTEYL